MSIRVMTAVFDYSESTGSDRLVLLVIADRSNDDGTGCWRGKESIARMARVSRATVTRSIDHLEELGELVVDRRPGTTSEYQIVLPRVGSDCADPPARGAQIEPGVGSPVSRGVGSPVSRDTSIDTSSIRGPILDSTSSVGECPRCHLALLACECPTTEDIPAAGVVLEIVSPDSHREYMDQARSSVTRGRGGKTLDRE